MYRFLFFCLLFISSAAVAQGARQYSFTHFSTANGLAANMVTSIVQDADGYMWFSTINGLQRYDGNSFLTIRSEGRPGSLPSDNIPLLYADRKKTLWLSDNQNRIGTFDPRTLRFKEVKADYRRQQNSFRPKYFFETPEGDLMIQERFVGLYRFDAKANRFVQADEVAPAPRGWRRDAVSWDSTQKKYWISCDSGLACYDPIRKVLSYRGNNRANDPVIARLSALTHVSWAQSDTEGNLMVVNWEPAMGTPTLHVYERKTGRYAKNYTAHLLSTGYNEVSGIFGQSNGRTWIFGHPFLAEWKGGKADLSFSIIPNEYRDEQSIRFDYLYRMYEDREKNVWLCTNNGLYHFNPEGQVFNSHNLIRYGDKAAHEAPANAFLETSSGILYVGCWNQGIYSYDRNFNPVPLPKAFSNPRYKKMSVWDMHEHSRTGYIWITQQEGYVFVYDPATGKHWEWQPEVFGKRTIRQVTEDRDGNLWFGTQGGAIVKWNYEPGNPDPTKGFSFVTRRYLITKMLVDSEGFLWASSEGFGLLKIDPRSGQTIKIFTGSGPASERLFSDNPTDIIQYDDTTLVVVSSALNLLNMRTNKVTHFTTADGLPSNSATSVTKDRNNILWVGMVDGLCRVNLKRKVVNHFDRRDGMSYDNFSSASAHRISDGRLLFTTDHNFLVFYPAALVESVPPPKPVITAFRAGSRSLLVDSLNREKKLVLHYNNNSISFEFSALSFHKQKRPHYFYKLENMDKDWIHADEIHPAVYNYLPPGDYVFKVKTENADGLTSEETSSFLIVVRPPIWNTWWFYGALVLAGIGILVWLDRERMSRLRALQRMRSGIAGNLHHDINTTLSNISILSEMAKMKAGKDIVRSKEYIQQISEKSHNMMTAMDDMLWSIHPENDTMEKTLLRLNEFIDALQSRYEARIHLVVESKVRSLRLDMDTRHNFFLLLKATLRAVVEDAGGKNTTLQIENTRSSLLLKIRDYTATTPGGQFTKRISEMRERASSIDAELDLQTDSKGVSVIVAVPL